MTAAPLREDGNIFLDENMMDNAAHQERFLVKPKIPMHGGRRVMEVERRGAVHVLRHNVNDLAGKLVST